MLPLSEDKDHGQGENDNRGATCGAGPHMAQIDDAGVPRNAGMNIAHPLKSDRPIAASKPSVSMTDGVTLPQSSTRGSMQKDQPEAKPMTPNATSMRQPILPAPHLSDLPKAKSNFVGAPICDLIFFIVHAHGQ